MQKLMKQQPGTVTASALKTVNSVLYMLQVCHWKPKFQHLSSIPPTRRPSLPPPAPLDQSHSYSFLNRFIVEFIGEGSDAIAVYVCRRVLHHHSAPK